MHIVAELHRTTKRKLWVAPVGFGVVWIVQLLPFHRSASGMQAVPVRLRPTAVQAAAEEHETPSSRLPCVPLGTLAVSSVQFVPFHRSARGT